MCNLHVVLSSRLLLSEIFSMGALQVLRASFTMLAVTTAEQSFESIVIYRHVHSWILDMANP